MWTPRRRKGIVERAGLDKVRHTDVDVLWLQEQEVRGRVPLSKIDGTRNPADLMTKHLESTKTAIHLVTMNLAFKGGRAEAAAHLYAMKAIDEHETTSQREVVTLPCHCYKWKETGGNVVIGEGDEDEGHEDERSETGKEGDQREEDGGDERSETRKEGDQREEETNRKMGGRHDSWGRDNYEDHEGAAAHDRWTCRGRELT